MVCITNFSLKRYLHAIQLPTLMFSEEIPFFPSFPYIFICLFIIERKKDYSVLYTKVGLKAKEA